MEQTGIQTQEHVQNKLQEYIQNWSKSTLTTVDCLKATNIIKLKKKFGDDALKIAITDLMIEKMELFNAKFRMTDVQIRFFNERFLEEYKFDTVADLSVCLNNVDAGETKIKFKNTSGIISDKYDRFLIS